MNSTRAYTRFVFARLYVYALCLCYIVLFCVSLGLLEFCIVNNRKIRVPVPECLFVLCVYALLFIYLFECIAVNIQYSQMQNSLSFFGCDGKEHIVAKNLLFQNANDHTLYMPLCAFDDEYDRITASSSYHKICFFGQIAMNYLGDSKCRLYGIS